ncbi:Acetyl-CoA:oxalate CoA-transferase [subsurface metagenome]
MGPLEGIKVLEFAGLGPAPFAAMMLADMGAEVLRIDRPWEIRSSSPIESSKDVLNRGRMSVGIDLKNSHGVEVVFELLKTADALIEGYRPGVMERLGLGPDICLEKNPRLVYGRMTGWGQDGPLAHAAGHDINYIALAGVLNAIGRKGEAPVPPLNLVGDFGGGGMLLAFGILCALLEREKSGRGQVIDAAMVDGAAILMTMFYGFRAMGIWEDERGTNLLDGGAPFYDVYECKDGKFISLGALEPQFYAKLFELLGISREDLPDQMDRSQWPGIKEMVAQTVRTKTRKEWQDLLEGSDACFAPVLNMDEVAEHSHNVERKTFIEIDGVRQPAPAPRFSRTITEISRPPAHPGQHTDEALRKWGFSEEKIQSLHKAEAIV